MPQLTSHACSCAFVRYLAPPTSELLDLLPKRVKMLIFSHEQVVVMDEHGDKKWPERRAVPLNEDSRSKAFQYENPMFRVWVTKHVSHFCGANRQLSRIDPTVSNTCPSCSCINEDTSHVVRCPSPGRTTFYNEPGEDLSLHNIRCMLDAIDSYYSSFKRKT
eukprot:scaffold6945_cov80-Skeletonema_dohrnii-CCMP3373.AAC.3